MEIVSNIALISINETLVVQLVSFLIFLFIINRVMFRPLRETMRERERFMDSIHEETLAAGRRLDDVMEKLNEQDSIARHEARKVRADIETASAEAATSVLTETREEITALSARTEKDIDTMLTDAGKSMETEARQLAVSIMEKLLDRKVAV